MDDTVRFVDGQGSGLAVGRGQLTDNGKGLKAPESIILSVQAAKTYYNNDRRNHVERIILAAAVEGMIGGSPPYVPEALAAAGLGHIANVNTLDAKGIYERAALTFWNLANQVAQMVVFECRPMEGVEKNHNWAQWAKILARNFTKVVKEEWPDFITQMNILTGQLVKLGLSPASFSDEQDFRWRTIQYNKFFVPDSLQVDVSQWDRISVSSPVTVQYLYNVYVEESKNEDSDWNTEALGKFLLLKANTLTKSDDNRTPYGDMLAAQVAIQNGNVNTAAMFSDTVHLISMLYREYTGKISHYMFDPVNSGNGDDFLFKSVEQYDTFQEAMILFTYSPGEETVHSNRGVGHKIFPICQGLMQLDCHIFDMAKNAATLIVKSSSPSGRQMDPIKIIPGVVTDIGQAELQQNNLGSQINPLIATAQYFTSKVERTHTSSGDNPGVPDADRGSKSAPEVQMQAIKEFGPGKQNVNHFYKTWDVVIYQMAAKIFHAKAGGPSYDALERWKELCIAEDVPEQIFELRGAKKGKLPKHLSVRAARAAGDGSNLGLITGLNGIAGIAGGFNSIGQHYYRYDIIASRLGEDYADRYLGDSEVPDEVGSGASMAMLENIAIKSGEQPQATQENNHRVHIGTLMALIMDIIKQVQGQQMDPIDADKTLEIALQHGGDHIQMLSQDPLNKSFIDKITPSWRQITKFAQLNRVKAQNQQKTEINRRNQEEEKMNADMMEQNRKDQVANREQGRKDFESESKQARAKEQSDVKAQIMKKGTDGKIENERRKIDASAQNEARKIGARKPEDILSGQTTEQISQSLQSQVGATANPADFL